MTELEDRATTQSLELLLDDGLDGQVRAHWEALVTAGLPSQARHTGASNRPHVTLAVASAVTDEAEAALGEVAALLPLPLTLGGLVCFGERGGRQVLARLVVPSVGLLSLQARADEIFAALPGTSPLLRPGAWTAHVTLAQHVSTGQLGEAVEALGPLWVSSGRAVAVRRWDSDARRDWLVG